MEKCRFCGKEFTPPQHLFDNTSRYLCKECHQLTVYEIKHIVLETLTQLGIVEQPQMEAGV